MGEYTDATGAPDRSMGLSGRESSSDKLVDRLAHRVAANSCVGVDRRVVLALVSDDLGVAACLFALSTGTQSATTRRCGRANTHFLVHSVCMGFE